MNMNESVSKENADFENVYPAVIVCFAVILSGYIAGRLNWISHEGSAGLNKFVSHFALPALIFHSLATLQFESINWKFLLGIFIGKFIIFYGVCIITAIVNRPINFGKAALFAIFCTQSNDYALGYPIVASLYENSHKEYLNYLYLIAAISLVMLNPVGFILMELHKHNVQQVSQQGGNRRATAWLLLTLLQGIVLNPVVLMTLAGIAGNFIFNHSLPTALDGILKVLGNAFSATALFSLGLHMVGKVSNLKGKALILPSILILVKTLVLPLTIREVITFIDPGPTLNDTVDLSNYGFLYGTFPTAPGVFVYAVQYNLNVDLVASGMVASTFVSAPIMFLSAKMISLEKINMSKYRYELNSFTSDVGIISLIALMWVLGQFVMKKKWNGIPHFATFGLVCSQLFVCLGAILWSYLPSSSDWSLQLQFIIYAFGSYSSRMWAAIIPFILFLIQWRSLCYLIRIKIMLSLIGWGLPMAVVGSLVFFGPKQFANKGNINLNFPYGTLQVIVTAILLCFCLVTMIISLILLQRLKNEHHEYQSLLHNDNEHISASHNDPRSINISRTDGVDEEIKQLTECRGKEFSPKEKDSNPCSCVQDVEDMTVPFCPFEGSSSVVTQEDVLCSSSFACDVEQRKKCKTLLARYRSLDLSLSDGQATTNCYSSKKNEAMRHIILVLFLCLSCLVGIALCVWYLLSQEVSGIYIELEFLDAALNVGQGLLLFTLFGLDCQLILTFIEKLKKFLFNLECHPVQEKEEDDQSSSSNIRRTCEHFIKCHYENCIDAISLNRSFSDDEDFKFYANEFVDWALSCDLVCSRQEGIAIGQNLMMGSIIKSDGTTEIFVDSHRVYNFRNFFK